MANQDDSDVDGIFFEKTMGIPKENDLLRLVGFP